MSMTVCEQYRRQLALLSVKALNESEKTAALAHVSQCAACREYWKQLQAVASLYREDAERSVEPTHGPAFVRLARKPVVAWLTVPRAVAFAVGMFVLCAAIIFLRKTPQQQPDLANSVALRPTPISVPTIADSRRLVKSGLDALIETPESSRERSFVFSVGTRYEGP
jgi:hypothetical protein